MVGNSCWRGGTETTSLEEGEESVKFEEGLVGFERLRLNLIDLVESMRLLVVKTVFFCLAVLCEVRCLVSLSMYA